MSVVKEHVESSVLLAAVETRRRATRLLCAEAPRLADILLSGKTVRLPVSGAERTVWRAVYGAVHLKQTKDAEERLSVAVERFIRVQVRSAIAELRKLGTAKSAAENLSRMIFDPNQWNDRLVDIVTPALVRIMGDAAVATLRLMGVHVGSKSTATEWLERQDEEAPPGTRTEYPEWMRRDIAGQTRETMSQPYWAKISNTTRNDIERHLRRGLQDGLSIVDMAARMTETLGPAYRKARATNIARTESGHILNAGRDVSIRRVQDSLGEAGRHVGKEWHSVLGTTTRDTHAALDGMLADEEGLWPLGGVRVPWPAHFSLPPSERCQCQCTIIMRLGVNAPEDEIQAMIAEREQQIAGKEVEWTDEEKSAFLKENTNSFDMYRRPDGSWEKGRERLHDAIIAKHFEGKSPVSYPVSYMTGGGSASGKSGAFDMEGIKLPKNTVMVDSDEIKKMLPESRKLGLAGATFTHNESSYLSKKIVEKAAAEGYNTMWDGTGDNSIDSLFGKIKRLRSRGQPIRAVYVTVDTEKALERNIRRAKRTGRMVPPQYVRNIHANVSRVFPEAVRRGFFDEVSLWDTNGPKPKRIAVGKGKKLVVLDKEAYRRFLAKGK